MMAKENLFDLIRNEEVIIWAGAGMSMSAGFPSGKKLGEILIDNLTTAEKKQIDESVPLPDLAEEFYRLKGSNKNALIKILNQTFNVKSNNTNTHDKLALIPHIKTIITTNYDSLIEDSIGQNAQKIYNATHIPYINDKKIQVFKVHGDLDDPNSIIITKSDYDKFFQGNKDNSTFWSVIRERLATKSVCFIGYNLEDPNVSVIFDRITQSLGEHRKEAFIIAPNLPGHKVIQLAKKGITYINSTAEIIVAELLEHIKEYIITDIQNGKTSADTGRIFLGNLGLLPQLTSNSKNYAVSSLKATNKNIKGFANFTFKNENDFSTQLDDFTQGKNFDTLKISEDKIVGLDLRYGGVKFPDLERIAQLEFRSTPNIETNIDIRFKDGFEIGNVPARIYGSQFLIEIHLDFMNAELKLKIHLNKTKGVAFNFDYSHKDICRNVTEEIEFFSFLKRISEGNEFSVFSKFKSAISEAIPKSLELLELSESSLQYFKDLRIIENTYRIRFSDFKFSEINEENSKKVDYILSVINNDFLILDWDEEVEITLNEDYTDETVSQFQILSKKLLPLEIQKTFKQTIQLHDVSINLGYRKIELQEAITVNIEDIQNRTDNVVRVKSNLKKIHVTYKDEIPK